MKRAFAIRLRPMFKYFSALVLAVALFPIVAPAQSAPTSRPSTYAPFVAPASDEAEMAMHQFTVPKGFKVELFAAEPRLANPVSFCIDEHNRFYVVETFRRKGAVVDIRNEMSWLDEDTASRRVADRNAMVRRHRTPEEVEQMMQPSERIRILEDRDGDGKADFDKVFADGFNRLEDGIAAGVLVRGKDVFFTDIPSLWRLRDTNNDGVVDVRDELHYGYGVRYNFNGHDLHGLRFGPDGKLYFSMGDRGLYVEKTPDHRVVSNTDCGAVMRCNADGTELEVFATGLRNPQELAFDEFGNLFTGDNNSDAGDVARWVYVVEGGDSGWREGYQSQDWPVARGPWMQEGIWKTKPEYPAYYIVPPVVELKASGPAGLTHDPGTGLPEQLRGRFFLVDFRGSPANSSIHALLVKPKGATFEMIEQERIIGGLLPTDVEIGYNGMYIADWVDGWVVKGKGRIYRVFDEQALKDPLVAQTRKLIDQGMANRSREELMQLLGHADQRVRQAAQFELADRKQSEPFKVVAQDASANRLARLHGVWGLGQLARKQSKVLEGVVPLLGDADEEVRTQAAKVIGDVRYKPAYAAIEKAMSDSSARLKFYATLAIGKIGGKNAGAAAKVVDLIRENDDRDPYLRHAGVMALAWLGDRNAIDAAGKDSSRAVRMAALLALRHLGSPDVASFLDDKDPAVVLEAARAINDVPIESAMPKLAALIGREGLSEPVTTRALNANYREGTPQAASALAKFANASGEKEIYRVEALAMLGAWANVPGRDRITGNWRPLPPRDEKIAKDAAGPVLPEILKTAPEPVRVAAAKLVTKLGVGDPALLAELAADKKLGPELRAAALTALADRGGDKLAPAVDAALKDGHEQVRAAAVRALSKLPGGVGRLANVLDTAASVREQQAAISTLANIPGEQVDAILAGLLDKMLFHEKQPHPVRDEIRLDVLEAAAARKSSSQIAEKLAQYESMRNKNDPLGPWRETLAGGDAKIGELIFRERADVSCLRCHAVHGKGGKAGPDLAGIALRQKRDYMLESILFPSKVIAPGFETVAVRLKDGTTYAGQVKEEDEKTLQLVDPGKADVRIDKSKIKARKGGMSGMPDNIAQTMSKQDLRNLVEFLANLKTPPKEKRKPDKTAKRAGDDDDSK
jgi:quinoprotein glucose dehydrogenase